MHSLSVWSFFFTNNTRSPQGDMLGPMHPLSNISFNCNFISPSFSVHIWYGFVDIGAKPNKNSIEKPIFCFSGYRWISLGNTSLNYFIIGCSSILSLPISNSLVAWTTYSSHPFLLHLFNWNAVIIQTIMSFLFFFNVILCHSSLRHSIDLL